MNNLVYEWHGKMLSLSRLPVALLSTVLIQPMPYCVVFWVAALLMLNIHVIVPPNLWKAEWSYNDMGFIPCNMTMGQHRDPNISLNQESGAGPGETPLQCHVAIVPGSGTAC